EILERTGGKELAFAASDNPATRSVHFVGGNGGASWFTLLWPQTDVADANDANLSYHKPGQTMNIAGTDRPLRLGPDSPWQTLAPKQQITGFVCGQSNAHTNDPQTTLTNLNNNNIFAVATAMQSSNPSVVPVITLNNLNLGTAPGAAAPTQVG